jgi:hypothetical protein
MAKSCSDFTEAGVWLLKAAAVASPRLAGQALSSVLQHLTAGEQSAVWYHLVGYLVCCLLHTYACSFAGDGTLVPAGQAVSCSSWQQVSQPG